MHVFIDLLQVESMISGRFVRGLMFALTLPRLNHIFRLCHWYKISNNTLIPPMYTTLCHRYNCTSCGGIQLILTVGSFHTGLFPIVIEGGMIYLLNKRRSRTNPVQRVFRSFIYFVPSFNWLITDHFTLISIVIMKRQNHLPELV
jgi:hypothetical protein